jgi:hypothetical protein
MRLAASAVITSWILGSSASLLQETITDIAARQPIPAQVTRLEFVMVMVIAGLAATAYLTTSLTLASRIAAAQLVLIMLTVLMEARSRQTSAIVIASALMNSCLSAATRRLILESSVKVIQTARSAKFAHNAGVLLDLTVVTDRSQLMKSVIMV